MSAYRDFVSDFPSRCLEVLEMAEKQARLQQRDVTLSLMVASAGFVVPYERLSSKKEHPSGDSVRFSDASSRLDSLIKTSFVESELAKGAKSWCGGSLATISGDPDSWGELRAAKPLNRDKTVGGVIRVLRNALAHGNIFTYQNPISGIVFVSERRNDDNKITGFSFLRVSPEDFMAFLRGWFRFLKTTHIPAEIIESAIADAA